MNAMGITYRIGAYYGDNSHNHIWELADDAGIAGELYVSIETGEIMNIEVREDRRGEGIARALYETACETVEVYHAPETHRSLEGNAFAAAVGGPEIDTCDCCDTDIEEDEDY